MLETCSATRGNSPAGATMPAISVDQAGPAACDLFHPRQWRGLRHGLCRQAVRACSSGCMARTSSKARHRSRHRAADRAAGTAAASRRKAPSAAARPSRSAWARRAFGRVKSCDGRETILLVEDNPQGRGSDPARPQEEQHRQRGRHRPDGCRGGWRSSPRSDRPLPQLVLLDLKLPKIDGLEVLTNPRRAATRLLPW